MIPAMVGMPAVPIVPPVCGRLIFGRSSPFASDARLDAIPMLFANSDSEGVRKTAFEQLCRVTKRVTGSIDVFFDAGTVLVRRE
jgi:hypothetical protein